MNSPTDLETRIAQLEAIESIRNLKSRYASLADMKYTAAYERQPDDIMRRVAKQQAECFTIGAVWAGGTGFGADLIGRDALEVWFRKSPWRFAAHFYTGEHITLIDNRQAQATWRLWQLALRDDTNRTVLLAAVTSETYVRSDDGAWLIDTMRFDQLNMVECVEMPLPLAATFAGLDSVRAAALHKEEQ